MRSQEALGYSQYDIVDNGRAAVDAARQKDYDVVLMDVMYAALAS